MCTKVCRTCKVEKDIEEFPHQRKHGFRGTSGGYRLDCRVCTAAAARKYRKTYVPGRALRKDVDKYIYSACGVRVGDAKARAAKAMQPCNITVDTMYDLLMKQNMVCAISGVPMDCVKGSQYVISIDKIDPAKGYTHENVQWVCWAVNRAKGDMSLLELLYLCQAIVRCNDYPVREYTQVSGSATPV